MMAMMAVMYLIGSGHDMHCSSGFFFGCVWFVSRLRKNSGRAVCWLCCDVYVSADKESSDNKSNQTRIHIQKDEIKSIEI